MVTGTTKVKFWDIIKQLDFPKDLIYFLEEGLDMDAMESSLSIFRNLICESENDCIDVLYSTNLLEVILKPEFIKEFEDFHHLIASILLQISTYDKIEFSREELAQIFHAIPFVTNPKAKCDFASKALLFFMGNAYKHEFFIEFYNSNSYVSIVNTFTQLKDKVLNTSEDEEIILSRMEKNYLLTVFELIKF
jgi:hypothetical protein